MNELNGLTEKAGRYLGRVFNDACDKRLVGDYGMGLAITRKEAEESLEAARAFVQTVEDYLDRGAEQT